MLILSRTIMKYIRLKHEITGEVIRICVTNIKLHQVCIGVEAGSDWTILREELIDKTTEHHQ